MSRLTAPPEGEFFCEANKRAGEDQEALDAAARNIEDGGHLTPAAECRYQCAITGPAAVDRRVIIRHRP